MSAHFKWYPASEEVVVPWNARYSFPSQANKCVKITPRIPPKNGAVFQPGQIIRVEFPAQGYVNPINTTFEFDVTLQGWSTSNGEITRFQNNIQSIFNRVRLLYGATPLEDMINYNLIVRALTEWTSTNQTNSMDQVTISEGIGGFTRGNTAGSTFANADMNVRSSYIQGIDKSTNTGGTLAGLGVVPNQDAGNSGLGGGGQGAVCTRRYQVNLALGLLTQDKLLPVKFMASQLAIEFTLEQPAACIFTQQTTSASGLTPPTYAVTNFNLIPEILEFDASYDKMFLKGLQDGGVPLKFSSWHTFIFNTSGGANVNLLVQERSRSVKALFALQTRSPVSMYTDSHALLFDSAAYSGGYGAGNTMQNYQWRIGGRYFPAQPVQLSTNIGTAICNGGAEAFVELQKALNVVGDYRLSTSSNTTRWAIPEAATAVTVTNLTPVASTALPELDYTNTIVGWNQGTPVYFTNQLAGTATGTPASGHSGSAVYTSSIDLETSNGVEISGLNAEEQSDIAFIANWSAAQSSSFNLTVLSYFDAMIILRENNVLELIQ